MRDAINGVMRWGGGTTAPFTFSGIDGNGLYIENTGTNTANENIRIQASKSGDGANYSQFIIDPTSGFSFQTIGTGNGNVGIGTTNPQSKLAVNGTITTKEVVVTATGWSDFVFKKDYNLKRLSEVENYIKTNHHLEGIPTEKDVKAKGVAMGDLQTKLLKKIEELTMYTIAEDKKIEAQNRKIEALAKANEELSRRLNQDK